MNQKMLAVLAVAVGAYYLLSKSKSGPVFMDVNGRIITEVLCGQPVVFSVPGYENNTVWLSQLKDGQLHFDGPYPGYPGPYTMKCATDPGYYQTAVYELMPDGTKGQLIGTTELRVLGGN